MSKLSNAIKWFQHTDMKNSFLCTKDICMKRDRFYGGSCDRGYWLVHENLLDGSGYIPDKVLEYDPSKPDNGLDMTKSFFAKKVTYPDIFGQVKEALRSCSGHFSGPVAFDENQLKQIKKIDREAFIEIENTGVFTGIAEFSRAVDIVTYPKEKHSVLMAFYGAMIFLVSNKSAVMIRQYDPERMKDYRKRIFKVNVYNEQPKEEKGK